MKNKKTYWMPAPHHQCAHYIQYHQVPCKHGYTIEKHTIFSKMFNSGTDREKFIREQSKVIRQCATDEEYIQLYTVIQTLTA